MTTEQQPQTKRCRQLTYMERCARFPLDFTIELERNGKPEVKVPAAWEQANLVRLGPYGTGKLVFSPRVNIHAAAVFSAFFETLKASGLLGDILTYDGGFYPRLKRGTAPPRPGDSKDQYGQLLSNHSRGCAIDLNAKWNPMGHPPVGPRGVEGCLLAIIEVAQQVRVNVETAGHVWPAGIVCGALWKQASCDPMHFEVGTFES